MNFGRANVTPTIMPRMNANSTAMIIVSICGLLFLCWGCCATIAQGSQLPYSLADYLRVTGTSQPPRAPLERMVMDQVIEQAYSRCTCQSSHEYGKELHKKRGRHKQAQQHIRQDDE